jgi:hypothetical protein
MTNPNYQSTGSKFGITPKLIAGGLAASFAAACAFGTRLGLEVHTPFLGGIGNLGEEMMLGLPFGELLVCCAVVTYQEQMYSYSKPKMHKT